MKPADRLALITRRFAYIGIVLCVWLLWEAANDPYKYLRSADQAELWPENGSGVSASAEIPAELDYETIQKNISGAERLWAPLVKKPAPPPRKINMKEKVKDLKVLAVISEGHEVRFIIRDTKSNTQKVYKKGDSVRDLTLTGWSYGYLVLSYKGESIKLSF